MIFASFEPYRNIFLHLLICFAKRAFDRSTGQMNGSPSGSVRFTSLLKDYEQLATFDFSRRLVSIYEPAVQHPLCLIDSGCPKMARTLIPLSSEKAASTNQAPTACPRRT
jgi:hypothetical protein